MRKVDALVPQLLVWFAENARDLPWRKTRDPYAIWVSEIMLQQTQVKTVIPYWNSWMKRLPTIIDLARAKSTTVLKLWEGLGYYSRARNLQRAARIVVREHGQQFPRDFDKALALPGIGRYTAGAICSIAFNQPTPVLDGNVIRVLTRVFGIHGNPRERKIENRLWQLADELVQGAKNREPGRTRHCGALNQALMELGATVCTKLRPNCKQCPLRRHCVARRRGLTEHLPFGVQRAQTSARRLAAFVVCNGERFLIRRRKTGTVNAELWEFPTIEAPLRSASSAKLGRDCLGTHLDQWQPLGSIKHSITRYRIRIDAFITQTNGAIVNTQGSRWATMRDLERLPFSSAHRQVVEMLKNRLALQAAERRFNRQTPTRST